MTGWRTAPASTPPLPGSATAPASASAPISSHGAAGGAVRVTSAQLFGGAIEVQIDHHGAVYRLKQTSLGKLILTK